MTSRDLRSSIPTDVRVSFAAEARPSLASAARLVDHASPDRYDELWDGEDPRPQWRGFLSKIQSLPPEKLLERERFVRQSIASDGVTYNIYADARGKSRPWELDLLPFILPADEWSVIAAGVAQRARLLDAVLADLLGPQTTLREGLLPPALVFGQHGFLWPAHGISPPGGVFLHVYAVDLGRAPDGTFWVLGDRTQSPAGAAYSLQNRMTLSRVFPDELRELAVEPLTSFCATLQDSLARLAPTGGEPPLSVLLSPGPHNEAYFEHAFLARQLGFPLVEGQDLIVRADSVYLKTLRGLRRVHAILRRLDDDYCDPVELRADSAIGVPGLLSAVRAGNVLLANALGSGVLETSALHGFLPALSERLLGETLALPALASWWCGEVPALEYVRRHLHDLVIKPTYSSMHMEPQFGHALDEAGKAALLERVSAQPHAYVAQEWMHLSRAPVTAAFLPDPEPAAYPGPVRPAARGRDSHSSLREHRVFEGRSLALRVFAVATGDGYVVMPGGLTRVAPREGDVVSIQWGGSSKDTWILSADRASRQSPPTAPREARPSVPRGAPGRPRPGAFDIARGGVQIPSRVGESLFWMGRYSERCEAIARLLRAALVRLADAAEAERPALRSIGAVCAALGVVDTRPPAGCGDDAEAPEPDFIAAVFDPACAGGLAANVARLCASAGNVRERMSTDNWHVLGRLPQKLPGARPAIGAALEAIDEIVVGCVSLAGFAMDDMTRDESWRFLLLGRRLERLAHLAGVAGTVLALSPEGREHSLEWLLEAANSIVTFRARYRRAPELLPAIDLVVLDPSNPHAVVFQLRDLLRNLDASAEELGAVMPDAELRDLGRELAALDLAAVPAHDDAAVERVCQDLARLLGEVRAAAFRLSDEFQRLYFSHAGSRKSQDAQQAPSLEAR